MKQEDVNVARQLSVFNHRKKQAANDAQLLMNRIALLQKEEERARKKIDQTKDRASEVLAMREENERRIQAYIEASTEEKTLQRDIQEKIREQEIANRSAMSEQLQKQREKRREDVCEMLKEKKVLAKKMLDEQEEILRMKQKKREEGRRAEEEARLKRENEKRENDRKVKDLYMKKAAEEAMEVKRAEKLVKALEKKEREWMEKLQQAQCVQETAFEHLEYALLKDQSAVTGENATSRSNGENASGSSSSNSIGKLDRKKRSSSRPRGTSS